MNINEIIKQVAKLNNTTPEEVYAEIQIVLDVAFNSQDPEVQKKWAKIPLQGNRPTPEEVVPFLASQVVSSNKNEAVS